MSNGKAAKFLKIISIIIGLLYLANGLETLNLFPVFLLWIFYLRFVRYIPWRSVLDIEFYASLPLLLSTPANLTTVFLGDFAGSVFFFLLIFASFVLRLLLLQKSAKLNRLHNLTMLAVVAMMIFSFELFLDESELGLRFQMRGVGVEYVVTKSMFWAPKGFKEKFFIANKEFLISDVMSRKTDGPTIYFFGGSSTAGAVLPDPGLSFPYDVGKILDKKFPAKGIRVVNAGVGGYTTFQIRRLIQIYGPKIGADIAVFYIGRNDTQKSYGRYTHKQAHQILYGETEKTGPGMLGKIQSFLGGFHTYNFLVQITSVLKDYLKDTRLDITVRAVPIEDMEENLNLIKQTLDENYIRMLICTEAINDPKQLPAYEITMRTIREFAEKNDLPYIDIHAEIWKDPEASRLFYDDVHLTPEGHDRVAKIIADKIIEMGLR